MSKKNVGLFARPCWADATVDRRFPYLMDYLDWMGDEVVSHAKKTKMDVHDKTGRDAIRVNIERQLRDVDPIFFFHASHGGTNLLTGQDSSNLICCRGASTCRDPNHDILSGRIVYTLSCSSADKLGPAVIQADGISYIGYADVLTIYLVERKDADAAFKDIWTSGAKELLRGKTTGEAYDKIKQRYRAYIDYWELRPRDWLSPPMLNALRWNLQNLRLLGREDATIIEDGQEPMIKGTVIDESSKEPIPDAKVIADNYQRTTTDASGKYELTEVSPGNQIVAAFKPGYEGDYTDVTVKEDEVTLADLELLPCRIVQPDEDELVIADCAKDLGFFDPESNGYPIIDKDELYNGNPTCKAIDTCGIQAHAGGSGGKEFKVDIDKHPLLHLTMKAEKDTDTCLLLMVHNNDPEDFIRRFVIVGKTDSGSHGSGVPVGKGCFTIDDDGEWHDHTYNLRDLREDYPSAQTVRIVQFYSSKSCDGDHAFHFSSLVAKA